MILLINELLLLLLIMAAIAVERQKDLFASVVLLVICSLLCATLFVCMDAVDVALTEAAIGAGITSLLFLGTLAYTGYQKNHRVVLGQPISLLVVIATGLLLIYGVSDIPLFGGADAPVHTYLSPRYLYQSPSEIGVPNAVTSILASYRAYDTLGEVVVIFTALIGVLLLLGRDEKTPAN